MHLIAIYFLFHFFCKNKRKIFSLNNLFLFRLNPKNALIVSSKKDNPPNDKLVYNCYCKTERT